MRFDTHRNAADLINLFNHCMPCTKKIDIPTVFRCWNRMHTENKWAGLMEYWQITALQKDMPSISACIACGKCESHCPQHLQISQNLKLAAAELEPWYFKGAVKALRLFKFW